MFFCDFCFTVEIVQVVTRNGLPLLSPSIPEPRRRCLIAIRNSTSKRLHDASFPTMTETCLFPLIIVRNWTHPGHFPGEFGPLQNQNQQENILLWLQSNLPPCNRCYQGRACSAVLYGLCSAERRVLLRPPTACLHRVCRL